MTRPYIMADRDAWPADDRLRRAAGVYEIVVLGKTGRPKSLKRVGGIDNRGVLYIGCSGWLRGRLGTLWRMIYKGRKTGHIAGITYRKSRRIRAVAPRAQLAFRFKHCNDFVEQENELLRRYFRKFGEVPPLNGRAEFITKASD